MRAQYEIRNSNIENLTQLVSLVQSFAKEYNVSIDGAEYGRDGNRFWVTFNSEISLDATQEKALRTILTQGIQEPSVRKTIVKDRPKIEI